ncbi:GatB/YqeY domain-containing protein [Iamia sp. SCSIO 61187]|uniref:GatB/YqeY domain-containing protein n=1 Tax=Iamia sp. SCSIO 61187 TaxID=2722752 RepID=UPI001C625CC1|nr:GatB/YqeY domain-containing protein [Iamia sp. SCSIO 61187]QYG91137.1 GatB/YqeY domain-containing protein [Iamia sp. SCSIO 61187]
MAPLVDSLRADLVEALKAGDSVRSSALRLGLAAVANAEAVDPSGPTTAAGLAGDVARRGLSDADVVAVLAAERDDLRDQAAALRARGRAEADDLDARAAVLSVYLVTDESGRSRASH